MTFFELSRVNIHVSIASLGLWPALTDTMYITLDYSGYHKLHPMNVYHSQCSNATTQLTAMETITVCYLWSVGPVWDVKFSGAARVVTCGEDGTIRIWDSWSSHCVAVLTGHLGAVLSISLKQITGLCRFLNNLRLVMFSLSDQVLSLFVSHY